MFVANGLLSEPGDGKQYIDFGEGEFNRLNITANTHKQIPAARVNIDRCAIQRCQHGLLRFWAIGSPLAAHFGDPSTGRHINARAAGREIREYVSPVDSLGILRRRYASFGLRADHTAVSGTKSPWHD